MPSYISDLMPSLFDALYTPWGTLMDAYEDWRSLPHPQRSDNMPTLQHYLSLQRPSLLAMVQELRKFVLRHKHDIVHSERKHSWSAPHSVYARLGEIIDFLFDLEEEGLLRCDEEMVSAVRRLHAPILRLERICWQDSRTIPGPPPCRGDVAGAAAEGMRRTPECTRDDGSEGRGREASQRCRFPVRRAIPQRKGLISSWNFGRTTTRQALVEEEEKAQMSKVDAQAQEDCDEYHYAESFLNRLVAIVTSNERFLSSLCCLAMTGCSAGMWRLPLEDEEWRSVMLSGASSPYVSWNGQDDSGFFLIQDAYHEEPDGDNCSNMEPSVYAGLGYFSPMKSSSAVQQPVGLESITGKNSFCGRIAQRWTLPHQEDGERKLQELEPPCQDFPVGKKALVLERYDEERNVWVRQQGQSPG
ncbi:hypothetical protein GUITHDRAFT_108234 [Guillardia theta CCMP2712]|uniref:Uncharacterized protein n=1 Tax=Guillardia theta (strain CCMP2712) TaxID=905079 RepID=L1JBA0_GUITC|nr:hypothetical protein GUITHDRAFT_108234 [Guillardia theta CCMP2712]EKX45781.1 hypothetical protein GUITHDRAFT_108234 [Guillardia theta CCMP2712]|eukprot:XP_005832761.1 hypothetical protein GUITHDRAFT_108234 [Guillardia theta CCMP2712]